MSINWDNLSEEGSDASEGDDGQTGISINDPTPSSSAQRATVVIPAGLLLSAGGEPVQQADGASSGSSALQRRSTINWAKLSDSDSEEDNDFDEEEDPDGQSSRSSSEEDAAEAAAKAAADATKARLWAALLEEEKEAQQEKAEAEKRKQELRDRLVPTASAPAGLVGGPLKSSGAPAKQPKASKKKKPKNPDLRKSRLFKPKEKEKEKASSSDGQAGATGITVSDVSIPDYLVSFVLDDWMRAHNNQRPRRVIKQGWLEKTGPMGRSYLRRWTVLNEDKCEYYKHFGDTEARGAFDLKTIKEVAPSPSNSLEFRITTPDREFRFLTVNETERLEWVRFFEVAKRSLHEKTVYKRVDPPTIAQHNQLIIDIEIASMSQKKTIRMDGSLTYQAAQEFCARKFPHIPNLAGFELFIHKYQKFLSEMLSATEPVGNLLENRDRLDLRKRTT